MNTKMPRVFEILHPVVEVKEAPCIINPIVVDYLAWFDYPGTFWFHDQKA